MLTVWVGELTIAVVCTNSQGKYAGCLGSCTGYSGSCAYCKGKYTGFWDSTTGVVAVMAVVVVV